MSYRHRNLHLCGKTENTVRANKRNMFVVCVARGIFVFKEETNYSESNMK